MIEILNRYTRAVIYASASAETIAQAVVEAARVRANLSYADLREANLSGADLREANLSGAYLSRAYLSRADLRDADLSGAYLRDADLRDAYLSRADLRDADLSGAYLSRAYLSRADLRDADLSGAYLSRANLRDADLSGAKTDAATKMDRWSLVIVGSRHVITATDRLVAIGCQRHSLDWWLENYKTVGSESGYSAEEIEEYGGHLKRIEAAANALKSDLVARTA